MTCLTIILAAKHALSPLVWPAWQIHLSISNDLLLERQKTPSSAHASHPDLWQLLDIYGKCYRWPVNFLICFKTKSTHYKKANLEKQQQSKEAHACDTSITSSQMYYGACSVTWHKVIFPHQWRLVCVRTISVAIAGPKLWHLEARMRQQCCKRLEQVLRTCKCRRARQEQCTTCCLDDWHGCLCPLGLQGD